ncbi:MAG: hypothetical protein N3F09_09230 [Bacteroidia bacterium]|nr:hypothetical protein [Bacteroidia bacterium]
MLKKFLLNNLLLTIAGILILTQCSKKEKHVHIDGNESPYYDKVPRVKVENYINRLFIDIIGRQPTNAELKSEADHLIANHLAISVREELITKLQTDQTYRPGDSSYAIAASNRLYDLLTTRLCEGLGEKDFLHQKGIFVFAALQDSLQGNWADFYKHKKYIEELDKAAKAMWLFYHNQIEIEEYCSILINNYVTFHHTSTYMGNEDNTIIYTFNDLLFRAPTANEFQIARDMILNGTSGILFGQSGHSKGDYFQIITHCQEFYEGTVKWLYKTFLTRNPTTQEIMKAMNTLPFDKDIYKIQKQIFKSDEYAQFR